MDLIFGAASHEACDVGAHTTDKEFDGVDGIFAKGTASDPGDHVFDVFATDGLHVVLDFCVTQGRCGLHGNFVFVGEGEDILCRFEVGREGFVNISGLAKREDFLAQVEVGFWVGGGEDHIVIDGFV